MLKKWKKIEEKDHKIYDTVMPLYALYAGKTLKLSGIEAKGRRQEIVTAIIVDLAINRKSIDMSDLRGLIGDKTVEQLSEIICPIIGDVDEADIEDLLSAVKASEGTP